jgi:antitoxin component of MazEF toxin-antitoxin module
LEVLVQAVVRRVGNSLGVLIPIEVTRKLGIAPGDTIEIDENRIRAVQSKPNLHASLDAVKLEIGVRILSRFSVDEIRSRSLENLKRWKRQDVWGTVHEEWLRIVRAKSDGVLIGAMLGRDENSNRLRQSIPYTGMLTDKEVRAIREQRTV